MEQTNKIIDIRQMNFCITDTAVEFDLSENTLKENLYIGGGILTLGETLLILLLNLYLQTWLLQCNRRTPSAQIIWITIISIKGWYKQNNSNPYYKDTDNNQGSSYSYWATTWSIAKCNESKWNFVESWGWWYGPTY